MGKAPIGVPLRPRCVHVSRDFNLQSLIEVGFSLDMISILYSYHTVHLSQESTPWILFSWSRNTAPMRESTIATADSHRHTLRLQVSPVRNGPSVVKSFWLVHRRWRGAPSAHCVRLPDPQPRAASSSHTVANASMPCIDTVHCRCHRCRERRSYCSKDRPKCTRCQAGNFKCSYVVSRSVTIKES